MKNTPETERIQYFLPDDRNGIELYENNIPAFVSEEMDRCYGAMFSSIPYLQLAGALSNSTSTYVAYSDGAIRSIFLFERQGRTIKVLNGAIRIEQEEVTKFADYIFSKTPEITRILFSGLHMDGFQCKYPCQRYLAGEDIVVPFADKADDYSRRLGKNTRKSLRRHAAALEIQYAGSGYKLIEGNSIDKELIHMVVTWNRERMSRKHKISAYEDEAAERFRVLAVKDGLVGAFMIDGRICAATVCCRVGLSYYMIMTGHDSAYDEFSLGMLCRFHTVLECLRLKAKEINLMCGRLPYKYNLLGESRKYDCLAIYRNPAALLRDLKSAVAMAVRGHMMEAKFALLDCEKKEGHVAKAIARAILGWRALKKYMQER